MKSVMNHSFSTVPGITLPRARFNRSRGYKTTFDGDYLIPVAVREVVPGDTVSMKMNFFGRLATPLLPVMDNIFLDSFFFFVPTRLVWTNFKKFMGEQTDPADTTSYVVPVLDHTKAPLSTGFVNGSLYDYMGLPTQVNAIEDINALPIRGYNLIWNTHFRDQNLQDSVEVDMADTDTDPADYVLLKRGKRYDYFTSALPWAQKNNLSGGGAVTLPLGTSAPIYGKNMDFDSVDDSANHVNVYNSAGGSLRALVANSTYLFGSSGVDGSGTLEADLSNATAATINDIREAFQVQRLYEKDARGGTRYIELVKSHFGVTSSDLRATRPIYLGGGSTAININSVAQTSETNTTPQGTLTATGTFGGQHGFSKSFEEHGYIIGLVCARADITYQEGLDRMWSRSTRLDFYWPSLAHLGEQAILNKEIYCDASANDELVFGYQERFAEMRHGRSMITGKYRSNYATSLDAWHLSQEFGALPSLNSAFIQQNSPWDRVLAVATEHDFKFDAYFQENWVRPMPVYSVPGKIDHL